MRVFILKEGKEYNQGVAYLDDGTMVVVDNARKLISKTIDVAVTSVLQTTAGKMIFGRFDERTHTVYDKDRRACPREHAPAAASRSRALRRDCTLSGSVNPYRSRTRTIKVRLMKVSVILPAAGLGTRMGREKSGISRKQFMLLEGAPILIHTIRKFLRSPSVTEIVVALRAEDMDWARGLIHQEHPAKPVRLVEGGESRQQSVENALATSGAGYRSRRGTRCRTPVHRFRSGGTRDRRSGEDRRGDCRDRPRGHRQAGTQEQDPRDAFARASGDGADAAGVPVRAAEARVRARPAKMASPAPTNPAWWSAWKRSTSMWCRAAIGTSRSPSPLTWSWQDCFSPKNRRAKRRRELEIERDPNRPRVGCPSSHRRATADSGGVTVPSELGLEGHSDADILSHAITDALLGAAALGDIGMHFPDTDPRWKGADSLLFLAHAAGLVREPRIHHRQRRFDGDSGAAEAQGLSAADPRIAARGRWKSSWIVCR